MVFDGDKAGQHAAQKAIPLFVEAGVDGRVARLPAGVDPDDFVREREDGPAGFRRLVEGARPMLDQFIQDVVSDASIPDRVTALETIVALLVKVKDPTLRELYAGQLAGVLRMEPQQIRRAMQQGAARPRPGTSPSAPPAPTATAAEAGRLPPEELQLVLLLARYPELVRTADAARAGDLLIHPTLRQLHRAAVAQVSESGRLEVSAWLDAAPAAERSAVASALMDRSLADVADPPGLLRKLGARLEISRVEAEMAMNARMLRDALARGDEDTARALSQRGIELRKTKEGLMAALQRP